MARARGHYGGVALLVNNPLPVGTSLRPWYLDLFWEHFRGRGFDATQGGTNTTLATAAATGATTLAVVSATGFVVGEVIILGSNGRYQSVTLTAINGSTFTVAPPVRAKGFAAGAAVTHGWSDDAHPGHAQAYASWGQAVADAGQQTSMGGTNLLGSTGALETTGTDSRGVANIPTGWLSVGGVTSAATAYSATDALPAARTGNAVQLSATGTGDGIKSTTPVYVSEGNWLTLTAMLKHVSGSGGFELQITTPSGTVLSRSVDPAGSPTRPSVGAWGARDWAGLVVPAGVSAVEVRIVATGANAVAQVDDVRLMHARSKPTTNDYILGDPGAGGIVYMGDSWGIAALGGYGRLQTALEARLGKSITFRNSSVTGERLDNYVARFDTDVAPYRPTYVVIQYGANDLSQSRTQANMEADADQMIAKCVGIGAIAVFCGLPAITSKLATANSRNDQIRARVDASTG